MRWTLVLVLVLGCNSSEDSPRNMPTDAGNDSGRDANVSLMDAGHDSGSTADAGHDAGQDSGPACECSSGACCDGCDFRAAGTACGVDHVEYDDVCYVLPGGSTYPKTSALTRSYNTRRCDGTSAACPAATLETVDVYIDCRDQCPNAGACALGCTEADNDEPAIECWDPQSCSVDDEDFRQFGICDQIAP